MVGELYQAIYACKKISEVGAQHLLMDFTALKATLTTLPQGGDDSERLPQRYVKYVAREFHKCEALLKVILSPQETLVDTYKALIKDGNSDDFQRIVELKGLKTERATLLEQYSDLKGKFSLNLTNLELGKDMKKMWTGVTDVFSKKETKE